MSALSEDEALEVRTHTLAKTWLKQTYGQLSLSLSGWCLDKLLGLTLKKPELKISLFRFVDVLPALKSAQDCLLHAAAYFDTLSGPWHGLSSLCRSSAKIPYWRGLLSRMIFWSVRLMAARFLIGDALTAQKAVQKLWAQGLCTTIDLLGETTLTHSEANTYQRAYLDLLNNFDADAKKYDAQPVLESASWGSLPRVNISIKISSLCPRLDPLDFDHSVSEAVHALLPIVSAAIDKETFINIDMEQHDWHDLILAVAIQVFETFPHYPHFGIVVQAYLKRARQDLEMLEKCARLRGSPLTVRLVKGAYWDYEVIQAGLRGLEVPVFQQKGDTDANFEACTRYLMAHSNQLRPAFGSHNLRSLAHVVAVAEKLGMAKRDFEIQMLYGMADEAKALLVKEGFRVRVYAPIGDWLPGMAYLVRRLLENSANESFLQGRFLSYEAAESLLNPPVVTVSKFPDLSQQNTNFINQTSHDFSTPEGRSWIAGAMAQVRKQFPIDVQPLIAGQVCQAEKKMTRANPSNISETIACIGLSEPVHLEKAVQSASLAKSTWGQLPVSVRAECLRRAADQLLLAREELICLMTLETGKSVREAEADFAEAIDFCRYYAMQMERLAKGGGASSLPGEQNDLLYRPRGLTAVIAPWNFPLAILCGMTVAALVAGNAVIMKPAEQASAIGYRLCQILYAAGIYPEALHFVPGTGEVIGAALVAHPAVCVIAFTGSKSVGLDIMQKSSALAASQHHIKKVVAEMGGKNGIIIDADADMDEAISGCLASVFNYQGQKCSAASRLIIVGEIYETFKIRFIEALQTLSIGMAEDVSKNIGPVIDADAQARLLAVREKFKANLIAELPIPEGLNGHYVPPMIFETRHEDSPLMQEEFFGPVVTLFKVATFEDAIAVLNRSEYALTAGVYTRHPEHLLIAKQSIEAGNVYINRGITGAMVGRQPFGGFKLSGVGAKAGGPDYLLQFVEPVCVTENTMRRGFVG